MAAVLDGMAVEVSFGDVRYRCGFMAADTRGPFSAVPSLPSTVAATHSHSVRAVQALEARPKLSISITTADMLYLTQERLRRAMGRAGRHASAADECGEEL